MVSGPNLTLLIMGIVGDGLTLFGVPAILSDAVNDPVNNLPTMLIPTAIGVFLLLTTAHYGIRKADNFLGR